MEQLHRHLLAAAIASTFPFAPAAFAASSEIVLGTVVSTARRTETKLEDVPQRMEVVDKKDIDYTVSADLTDLLKKNASVDVIQYPGALSGIGIRGFRPEYGGINRHSALLIDGRPYSGDNMATMNSGLVERIEVLKGPGSALYGAGAMGGVVNLITRQSKGALRGQADLTAGEFSTWEGKLRVGGSLGAAADFDYAGAIFRQNDDFRMGDGNVRPSTAYGTDSHALRLGVDLAAGWRLNGRLEDWRGDDVATPGDVAYGINSQTNKDMKRSDRELGLTGRFGEHRVAATVFSGAQSYVSTKKTSTVAAERPNLPAVNYEQDLTFAGWQMQDAWAWSRDHALVFGVDNQFVKAVSRSYNNAVAGSPRKAPGTADNQRENIGVFAENTWSFNGGGTTAYVGIRRDWITVETLDTPYRTGFTPSASNFVSTNPSAGVKHQLTSRLAAHATIGKAFIAPDALYATGSHQTANSRGGFDYTTGNPGIRPETSLSWDAGLEWTAPGLSLDATIFQTTIDDRIVAVRSTVGVDSYANYTNASVGKIQGWEYQARWAINRMLTATLGGTHYFHNYDEVNGLKTDTNNVSKNSLKLSLDVEHGPWTGRLAVRHRGHFKDQDWVYDAGRQKTFAGITVADLSLRYRLDQAQSVGVQIENLGDKYYAEKFGFPLPGRNLKANYRYQF